MTLRQGVRLAIAGAVVVTLGVSLTVQYSSGGLTGSIINSGNSVGAATLLYTHTYSSSTCSSVPSGSIPTTSAFTCAGTVAPTAPTTATGSVSATDSIAYRGSATAAQVTQSVSGASCGVVQLANGKSTNAMLSRYGTTFAASTGPMTGSGAITLDGANPGGYESAVVSQTQPNPAVSLGSTFGLGVWFKTTSSAGGPLFGIGTSAANVSGGNDRILYMTTGGRLAFIQNTGGTTTTTTTSYNDGAWHFAYVTISAVNVIGLGLTSTTKIYVDGDAPVTGGGLLAGYVADTGYWHVGWSPVAGLPSYFTGSLSNFVIFNTANAPAAPSATQRMSQANFTTWAASATEHWLLNDTGMTTFGGSLPGGAANPCSVVNMSWGFTNPTSCGYSPTSTTAGCTDPPAASLAAFANGAARIIGSPAPGATQVSTIKLTRGSGYDASFDPGLRLYTPLTFKAASGGWVNTFTWSDATSVFLA